ncbi:MAG: pitrilysin family protein [Elusimicrobiota bacterium]
MRALALSLGLLAAGMPVFAQSIPYEEFTLPNGLRVFLIRDPSVPVVSLTLMAAAGSRNESPGLSGFAHLFEHLMFEGSAHVPRGRFDRILEAHGAANNASTHNDFTFYYETLPSNALALAAWLDADRLSALDVSEKNMRTQVDVVKEEIRQSVENRPYIPLLCYEIPGRAFSNWANQHPTVGTFEDLDRATLKEVRLFFDRHYAPSNLMMAVAGDFEPGQAKALLTRYFGWIPNRAETPAKPDLSEKPQSEQRAFDVTDVHAQVPGLAVVWSDMPPRGSKGYYAMALLGRMLFHGKSSRLYQLLVKDKQVAVAVDEPYAGGLGFPVSDVEEFKEAGLFGGFILTKDGVSADGVAALVLAEAARIAAEGVPPEELERAKTKLRSETIQGLQTTLGRAYAVLRAALLDGSPAVANEELSRFMAVSPDDVKAAASKHLLPTKANIFRLKAAR